ncbi:DUF5935 domain-containing protein [Altererythrobacter sp.]|uniref:DUF5935 domain-containing protein n=1 Tax=Altererythrobacter sp. TaxID=1872480 RepID=UPI003D03FF33
MIDFVFLAFLGFIMVLGLRRPFLWVLAYIYIDILAPQRIGYGILHSIPVSLIAFLAAFGGWLLLDYKKGARFTFRQGLMLALLLYCAWTTGHADFPVEAQEKWGWVWKALVFAIFLPLTVTTRLRIEALAMVMVLSVGAIIISAGMKTVGGGGGYENLYFFVNDNSGIYESSTLATVAIAIIPLIVWFTRHGTIFPPDWRVRTFSFALIFACLLIPIGTEARTGLLCIAVLCVMALRDVQHRLSFIVAGALLGLVALPFLPQSYYDRMATIGAPGQDESASTRVAVWEWTLDYASSHPLGGGFDAYRGNSFTYILPVRKEVGNTTSVKFEEVTDKARAYHSAIFEMLGEQGWPGLVLWLWLQALGVWQMERIRRRWKGRDEDGQRWQAPLAVALQISSVIYIVGALFQGIAYQPVILMIIGLQIGFHSYCLRIDSQGEEPKRLKRARIRRRSGGDAVAAG